MICVQKVAIVKGGADLDGTESKFDDVDVDFPGMKLGKSSEHMSMLI